MSLRIQSDMFDRVMEVLFSFSLVLLLVTCLDFVFFKFILGTSLDCSWVIGHRTNRIPWVELDSREFGNI